MLFERTLFEKILDVSASSTSRSRRWQPSVEQCAKWLQEKELSRDGDTDRPPQDAAHFDFINRGFPQVLALSTQRVRRLSSDELASLKEVHAARTSKSIYSSQELEALWQEFSNLENKIKTMKVDRVPADALGFYRPFHFQPESEWGIYLLIEPMLNQCETLHKLISPSRRALDKQTLLGCMLFEVFHHEFFHHLTECAATTMEIISAGFGEPKPLYWNYWQQTFKEVEGLGAHPDDPLEEALANAYAYNSFSFLSRTQIGFKTLWVRAYQSILKRSWPLEPAGYKSAGNYVDGDYVMGAAQLLAMILADSSLDPASLLLMFMGRPGVHLAKSPIKSGLRRPERPL